MLSTYIELLFKRRKIFEVKYLMLLIILKAKTNKVHQLSHSWRNQNCFEMTHYLDNGNIIDYFLFLNLARRNFYKQEIIHELLSNNIWDA